jgi:hypothetical protein
MKTQFRLPGGDLEYAVLVIGAILGVDGRHTVLRLGLCERWRQHFAVLLERVAALAISTVEQLADYLIIQRPGHGNHVPQPTNSI